MREEREQEMEDGERKTRGLESRTNGEGPLIYHLQLNVLPTPYFNLVPV